MSEELNLVRDLAAILVAAGLFTVIFKALKQPVILGYIIAGFLIGPKLGLFPELTSEGAVKQWSDIGIIFLLFALGLEFSFKKLMKVGASALIMAVTKCIGMFIAGIILADLMGWSSIEGLFIGGLLSMSSTVIVIKAYDDMGLKNKPYSSVVFGSLVFEDLIAVLLMVLLSTIASATGGNTGKALIESVIKLIFFLVLWFVVGMYLLPMIFKKIKKFLSNEILLIISIGLCFLMVTLADLVGFSSALGAFVMGSLLAETVEGENIERLVGGIKDLFGAIFFVSVGMMVDPAIIAQYWFTIVLLIIVAILGRLIFSTAGALLSGQGISNAVHASFSLSQLGEFAFIIASLGCSLGVMRDFFYPAVVAASAITTFTTPFMIKAADPVTNWLYKVLPTKVISRLDTAADKEPSSSKASSSVWKKVLKSYFTRVLVYYVILLAIYLTSVSYMPALVNTFLPDFSETVRNIVSVVVTLAVMTPFIFGLVKNSKTIKEGTQHLLEVKRSNRWPILALLLFRMTLAVGVIVGTIMTHFELSHFDIILVAIALVSIIMQTRNSVHKFSRLEDTFEANLNDKELAERRKNPVSSSVKEKMAGYDVHIEAVTLPQESRFAGAKLRDMPFRKDHSINIIKIQRGRKTILIPNGDEPVFPCDVLLAVGTTEQIEKFREKMDEVALRIEAEAGGKDVHEDFIVDSYTLTDESFLVGKTLRQSDMRHSGCMMISVMRDGKFTANPDADTPFKAGDTVWIAGEKEACKWFV